MTSLRTYTEFWKTPGGLPCLLLKYHHLWEKELHFFYRNAGGGGEGSMYLIPP